MHAAWLCKLKRMIFFFHNLSQTSRLLRRLWWWRPRIIKVFALEHLYCRRKTYHSLNCVFLSFAALFAASHHCSHNCRPAPGDSFLQCRQRRVQSDDKSFLLVLLSDVHLLCQHHANRPNMWVVVRLCLISVRPSIALSLDWWSLGSCDGQRTWLCLSPAAVLYFDFDSSFSVPIEATVFINQCFLNHWYSLRAYYIAKFTADLPLQVSPCTSLVFIQPPSSGQAPLVNPLNIFNPFQLICPMLFVTISYFMTGQPCEADRFIRLLIICILMAVLSHSLGLLAGAAFSVKVSAAVFLLTLFWPSSDR